MNSGTARSKLTMGLTTYHGLCPIKQTLCQLLTKTEFSKYSRLKISVEWSTRKLIWLKAPHSQVCSLRAYIPVRLRTYTMAAEMATFTRHRSTQTVRRPNQSKSSPLNLKKATCLSAISRLEQAYCPWANTYHTYTHWKVNKFGKVET